jgi:nucleoside-diphosphate-sugar epimerase
MMSVMSVMVKPFESFLPLPDSYTSEGLRILAGVTYIGSNAKARRELGYTPRPLKEGLTVTLRHEMKLLGM